MSELTCRARCDNLLDDPYGARVRACGFCQKADTFVSDYGGDSFVRENPSGTATARFFEKGTNKVAVGVRDGHIFMPVENDGTLTEVQRNMVTDLGSSGIQPKFTGLLPGNTGVLRPLAQI
jgi:hypothetical protein